MTFEKQDIKKYQELCKDYFNEEVTESAAIEELNSLMFLVNLVYHPQIKQKLAEVVAAEEKAKTGQHEQLGQLSKDDGVK
ncbi:hypothetical protein [Streptomyces sp. TLI_146]|uniref:hypothetical protein n=1 Tax=Streptomyces sp. TLI_146 TaxID=1938858 RepID=UPI000CBF9961|nr:hypothetical protein [Streptomyces sp. TLI_146]PKV88185.1 hypothetical protein BX283_5796 [Streptomyces sp. TLI_146]